MNLKLDILSPSQKQLFSELSNIPSNFVLYGETALALRLGHRKSIDFDFFSSDPFNPKELFNTIYFLKGSEKSQIDKNTLTCLVKRLNESIKVSFFWGLSFARLSSPEICSDPKIAIASLADLSATKIQVIQDRAEIKDYIDIAELLEHFTLEQILSNAIAVFGKKFNPLLSLKALIFYEDGNLPQLDIRTKQKLTAKVNKIDLLNLPKVKIEDKRLI